MGRVVHFDVPVDVPERASEFYQDAFGWDVHRWGPVEYWPMSAGEDAGPGAEGALTMRRDAPEGILVYIAVDDIDTAMKRVEAAGGELDGDKMAIPAIGWSAHVRDSEGNLIGLFQEDATVQQVEAH